MNYTAFLSPCDPNLEIQIIQRSLHILQNCYRNYTTSLETDEEILMNQNINQRTRFAVLYRIGCKKCLVSQIRLLEALLPVLENLISKVAFDIAILNMEYSYLGCLDSYLSCLRLFYN